MPLSISRVTCPWIDERFGYGQQFLWRKLLPPHACDAVGKFHTESLIGGACDAGILPAVVVCHSTGEMHAVEVVYQSVLPIKQELRSLFCEFLCRLKVCANEPDIPDRIGRLTKV